MVSEFDPHRVSFTETRCSMLPLADFPALVPAIVPPSHVTVAGMVQYKQAAPGQEGAMISFVLLKQVTLAGRGFALSSAAQANGDRVRCVSSFANGRQTWVRKARTTRAIVVAHAAQTLRFPGPRHPVQTMLTGSSVSGLCG